FSSPTLFALGSFSGLEAFSRPDLLADEAGTCGEEMKLNGEVELQVFLWFFSAQLPRFPFQASRSVGGSELHSLLLGAVRLVECGKDEDENQMMRNGESVLFGKCSFCLQPIQQTPDGTSHGSQVDLYEIPYPAAGVYCRSTVWFSSNYLPLRRTLERIEENRRRADNRKQARFTPYEDSRNHRRTDHSQGNQGYYNERPENRNHHYDGRREHLPDRSFSANENRERHRTRSREPTYRLPPIRESSDVSLRSRGMHSANPPVKNVWRPVSRDRENGGHSNSVQSQVSHTPSPLPPRERITSPNITPQGTPRPAGEKSATPSARRSALERLCDGETLMPQWEKDAQRWLASPLPPLGSLYSIIELQIQSLEGYMRLTSNTWKKCFLTRPRKLPQYLQAQDYLQAVKEWMLGCWKDPQYEFSPIVEDIERYDPTFIMRFSVHSLSVGYIEPLEFAILGLLAVAFVSMSSADLGMRKLAYDTIKMFLDVLENL
uniref:Uncharacterized protein n=1 Tax=Brassica oleracea var. oleracea TaxID=109376 RepID=A0A0D3BN27_BRAOL